MCTCVLSQCFRGLRCVHNQIKVFFKVYYFYNRWFLRPLTSYKNGKAVVSFQFHLDRRLLRLQCGQYIYCHKIHSTNIYDRASQKPLFARLFLKYILMPISDCSHKENCSYLFDLFPKLHALCLFPCLENNNSRHLKTLRNQKRLSQEL